MYASKFKRILKTALHPESLKPTTAGIFITYRCNSRCIMCNNWRRKTPELPTERWKAIFIQLKEFGIKYLNFSGGEPLLRKDLFELAEYAKDLGLRTALFTNGFVIDKFINKLACFDEIAFSLDSLKIHDKIRGTKLAKKVIGNIELCLKKGYNLKITSVLTSINYKEIPELVKFATKRGIALEPVIVHLDSYYNTAHHDLNLLKFDVDELDSLLKKYVKNTFVTGVYEDYEIIIKKLRGEQVKSRCLNPFFILGIAPDGKIFPCYGPLPSVGDINKNSIQEIWDSYKGLRMQVLNGEREECQRCFCVISRYYTIQKILKKININIQRLRDTLNKKILK
ncbi:MAG: radical SAM protein [Candidatus Parvarchaeota archaeon]|nr:radical SAM protein [Candidatus Jingweiarchaeum tengchongense]MCW1310750.1 radical SAM protein [Candidatus Jingweiarchaeum tengchongense]